MFEIKGANYYAKRGALLIEQEEGQKRTVGVIFSMGWGR